MARQEYIELISALLAENAAVVESRVCATNFEFDQFIAFTDLHHLSGYLFLKIKGSSLEAVFPAECLEHLGKHYVQQQRRCDDILRESADIYDRFNAANLPVIFLKGPFLSQQFYGDIHERFYWDVDILIHREHILAADQLLREMDFKMLSLVFISHNTMNRFTHTYDYHKRIARPSRSDYKQYLPLDLHWRLRSHFSFRLDYENIWNQQDECLLQGRPFPVLSAEYSLVMNVLGMFFDLELGTIRLKSFLDLYKILDAVDSCTDWDAFFEKRASENIFCIILNVIDILLDVLDCRKRFPGVASYIETNRRLIHVMDTPGKYRLLERSRFSLDSRRWAHSLYQAPILQSILWTSISLPFRIAAHDRIFQRYMGRLK